MESTDNAMREALLLSYFRNNGLLLCNESRELPYLEAVGGDWNSIVALIESGDVFYSKLYKGRVTYLSREFYASVLDARQRLDSVTATARAVYDFLSSVGKATTPEIKSVLMLSQKAYTAAMDELLRELLVTALERDRTMNVTWGSFYYGTYEAWEAMHPLDGMLLSSDAPARLTKNILTEKQLAGLLNTGKRKA